jgi:hypothetical protein
MVGEKASGHPPTSAVRSASASFTPSPRNPTAEEQSAWQRQMTPLWGASPVGR